MAISCTVLITPCCIIPFWLAPPGSLPADAYEEDDLDLGMDVGVTQEELDQLKHDAVLAINDTLLKRLQDIEQVGYWS